MAQRGAMSWHAGKRVATSRAGSWSTSPAGVTSTSVVNKLRWAFDAKKAGHAGTLDPDATGLLPVALGEATKTIAYLGDVLKAYEFTVRWGSQDDNRRRGG
jgi:tRNA pseudouridine(55) synthase